MPLILVRIDDRLIHGQVVVGWGSYLNPDRIILCSDEIASSEWEKEIYLSAASDIEASVLTVEETAQYLRQDTGERIILLVESPEVIVNLIKKGVAIKSVNIGGMHFKEGKRQFTPYVFLDDEDIRNFNILKNMNIELEIRDIPTRKKTDLAKIIDP